MDIRLKTELLPSVVDALDAAEKALNSSRPDEAYPDTVHAHNEALNKIKKARETLDPYLSNKKNSKLKDML